MTESELFVDDNLRSWYVIYKVIVCLFFWSSIIYSWVVDSSGSTYLVFMTNWGICFLCPTILLETVIVLMMSSNLSPPSLVMLGNLSLSLQAQLTSTPPSRHGPRPRLLHLRPVYLHPVLVPPLRVHQSPLLYRPLCPRTSGEQAAQDELFTLTSTSGNFCSS